MSEGDCRHLNNGFSASAHQNPWCQACIYLAIYKLENDGYISEYSQTAGKRRVRIYYHLEEKGRDYLKDLLTAYKQVSQGFTSVLQFLDQ